MPCKTQSSHPFAPALSRLSAALAALVLSASPVLADDFPTNPVPPTVAAPAWGPTGPGAFVTALCRDPQGRVVIATEGNGLWRYEPTSGQYAHFTQSDTKVRL